MYLNTMITDEISNHGRQVETFLMHPTFSSKGGFRIIINGIKILKVFQDHEDDDDDDDDDDGSSFDAFSHRSTGHWNQTGTRNIQHNV